MRTTTLCIAATSCALQLRPPPSRRRAVIRMISERQIPAYVQTMKLYESENGVETLPACGSATVKFVFVSFLGAQVPVMRDLSL